MTVRPVKRRSLDIALLGVALLCSGIETAHARRRGGGHGNGGDGLSALDPFVPYIFIGVLAIVSLLIIWAVWKYFRQPSEEARVNEEAARRRAQRRLERRR